MGDDVQLHFCLPQHANNSAQLNLAPLKASMASDTGAGCIRIFEHTT